MSSYLVPVGSSRSIVIRAFNADHAHERVERRLMAKGDRTTPVISSLIRELSEIEVQRLKISKKVMSFRDAIALEEVGGASW